MRFKDQARDAARTLYKAVEKTGLTRGVHQRLALAAAKSGLTVKAHLHSGDVLHVDLAGTVGRSIWLRGRYDDELVQFLVEALAPGDVFIDVGANVGYYTAMAARAVGASGVVVAVEPGALPLSLLARSAAENRWRNVVILSLAASETTALLRFQAEDDPGLSHISSEGAQVVGAVRLGDVLTPWLAGRSVGGLKLDVEQHELAALAGLEPLFAAAPPRRVLTEAHVAAGEAWLNALFAFFTTRGYRAVEPVSRRAIGVADVSPSLWNVGFVRD